MAGVLLYPFDRMGRYMYIYGMMIVVFVFALSIAHTADKINVYYVEDVAELFLSAFSADSAASWRRSCSFSRFKPSTSTFLGAPMYRFMYSIALLGRSGSSYKPTKTLVRVSKTPVFSRYFRNSSFLEPSLLLLLLLLLLLD